MQTATFEFGLRKVLKVRHSFLLPIPIVWIRNMQVDKGDSLKIEMLDDKTLRISPISRDTI